MSEPRVAGIVLAAGASRRMGFAKALATIDGEPFVVRVVRTLRAGGCDPVVVVVGPPHEDRVREIVRAAEPSARFARNPEPERGMLSSLQLALASVPAEREGALVALVDQPRVAAATVTAIVRAFEASGADVVQPVCDGRRGHPYLVARSVFDALSHAPLEAGARPVVAGARHRREIAVADPAIHDDLDTPEALAAAGAKPPE